MKDVKATEEAFSPQKRTSSSSKHEISELFLIFWVIFSLLGPVSDPADQNQCRPGSRTLSLVSVVNFNSKIQNYTYRRTRVVDPYSFFPDPDPEFDVGDQYGSGSNTDPGL
jgi:hypothetical protein